MTYKSWQFRRSSEVIHTCEVLTYGKTDQGFSNEMLQNSNLVPFKVSICAYLMHFSILFFHDSKLNMILKWSLYYWSS